MTQSFLGLEIGGTKLQFVVGDESAKIRGRRRFTVERAGGGEAIRRQIQATLPELLAATKPRALAVGFGGPVDRATGTIAVSHQIEGWSGFALRDWLHTLSGLPVIVENDANTATLGEARHGAGVGCDPVFYVTLGSGVGGGLVVNGRIYHGSKPGEAELGHVRLDKQGTIVEHRCSGWAVDGRIRELRAKTPDSVLSRLTANAHGGEARFLADALQQDDPLARQILGETAEDLAFALSHVVHLFHSEIVVLGGGLAFVGEPLRAAVADALPRFIMDVFKPGPRVALAALGEDAVPVGALVLARSLESNL
ncbi:MAG: ROK family protein [Verrucomicrobia bacterium]|nr:ROK family protein [Verrucomicrobiota bacterium]